MRKVYDLPLTTFWALHKQIDRLNSEDDIRQMQLLVAVQSSEGLKAHSKQLTSQVGVVAEFDAGKLAVAKAEEEQLDREGLMRLKAMSRVR